MVPASDPDQEIVSIAPKTRKERLVAEIRSRPFGYSVLAVGLVLGPVLLKMIFPDITTLQAVTGGLAFGVYATLSAVPQKFM